MWLNQMCETQLQWYYDNGIVLITGRDVVCIMTGILIGVVFAYTIEFINWFIEERKKK